MTTSTTDRIITAQRLRDGAVVFLGRNKNWVETPDAAYPMTESDAEAQLAWAKNASVQLEVVDAYAVQLAPSEGEIVPIKVREQIRLVGPTVRPDLQRVGS